MAESLDGKRRGRKILIPLILIALALGGGAAAYASTSSSGAGYRTATAGTAQIDQTVEAVGSAVAASPKTYAFSTSGTVATVTVKVGQQVAAGQTLASLDQTSLNNALTQAQLAVANAKLTLENDETGKGSSSSNSSRSGATTSSSQNAQGPATATGPSTADITAAQKAVTTAQHTVDGDIAAQNTLLTTATTTCADPTKTAQDCANAQQAVATALAKTSTDEAALLTAQKQLTTLLTQLATAGTSTPSQAASSPKIASAEQLAADQAAIDAATAQVAVAQENLSRTNLVAKAGGTVLAVGLTVGSVVSANSTTATILVADPTSYSFSLTLPVTDLISLTVGDKATVLPDGTSTKLPGKVSSVGLAPTTTAGSSYAVVVSLDQQPTGLRTGMTATVTIATSSVSAAVAIPTSALTRSGTTYSAITLSSGKPVSKTVAVGVSGVSMTEIKSGLAVGDVVVIADPHAKLPTSNTANPVLRSLTGTGVTGGLGSGSALTGGGGLGSGGGGLGSGGGGLGTGGGGLGTGGFQAPNRN